MKKKYLLIIGILIGLIGCGSNKADITNSQNIPKEDTKQENIIKTEDRFNPEDIGKTFGYGDYEYTVLEDGTALLSSYSGDDEILKIPDNIEGYTISQIGAECIFDDSVAELTIPGSVKVIYGDAIGGSSIKSLILEEGVEIITPSSHYLVNLTNLSLPSSLKYVGLNLMECLDTTENLEYYEGVYYIDNIACGINRNGKNLSEIKFKEGTCGISGNAFCNTSGGSHGDGVNLPHEIIIPEGVKFIGANAFLGRSEIDKIQIPSSVSEIGSKAIGYRYINYEYMQMAGVKIYSYEGTKAEKYATENNIEFVTLR